MKRTLLAERAKTRSVEARKVEARSMNVRNVEARNVEAHRVEARSMNVRNVEARNVEARRVKAAVFDLGGVIIDDLDTVYSSYCHVIRKFGKKPMAKATFNRKFSPDWLQMYRAVGILAEPEEIRSAYLEVSVDPSIHKASSLFAGALKSLQELKKGRKIALNTGYRSEELEVAFNAFNISREFFDSIMTEDRAGARKPDPVTLRKVAEELGLNPEDLVFVGDTVTDIECGKNAGCSTIAVTWGANSKRDLESAEPDYLVDSWEELRALLERL